MRQLSLDDIIPEQVLMPQEIKQASEPITAPKFDPEKKICHGMPMRKVELGSGRFAYRCDECQTLMVKAGKD